MTSHTASGPKPTVAAAADPLETFFGLFESMLCPAPGTFARESDQPPTDPDLVDYVFENVESYVCVDERTLPDGDDASRTKAADWYSLDRDNSLLVDQPGNSAARGPRPSHSRRRRPIQPMGQEGDLVDYVFENVESFVCRDDILDGNNNNNNNSRNNGVDGNRANKELGNRRGRPCYDSSEQRYGHFLSFPSPNKRDHDPTTRTEDVSPPREITIPMDANSESFDRYSSMYDNKYTEEDEIQLFFRPIPSK